VEVAIANAGGEGSGFAHGLWVPQEEPPQRGKDAGGVGSSQGRLRGGFRGHSEGRRACGVSSAQPWADRGFPYLGGLGVGYPGGLFPQVEFL
jgi:hypothetical protein